MSSHDLAYYTLIVLNITLSQAHTYYFNTPSNNSNNHSTHTHSLSFITCRQTEYYHIDY